MDKLSTIGDAYRIRGCDFVVARRTWIKRGRNAGGFNIFLAPLGEMKGRKNAYAMNAIVHVGRTTRGLDAATGTYTKAHIDAAIAKATGTAQAVEERKEKRAEAGRAAISPDLGASGTSVIEPGDTVTIRYRGGEKRDERVVETNTATGKVAIFSLHAASRKRWLSATQVVAVRKRTEATYTGVCSICHKVEGKCTCDDIAVKEYNARQAAPPPPAPKPATAKPATAKPAAPVEASPEIDKSKPYWWLHAANAKRAAAKGQK